MNIHQFRTLIVEPGLLFLPEEMRAEQAAFLLTVVAGVESARTARYQIKGTAHSFFQFERIGVAGLMGQPVTSLTLRDACLTFVVPYDAQTIYDVITWCDALATICARLLLWADPKPIPEIGDVEESWVPYQPCWRPGKLDRVRGDRVYAETHRDWHPQVLIA